MGGEKGATPGRRRLLQDVPKDSRQLIGRVETLLPKWVGVMLALILALGVIAGILAAMVVTITSFQAQMPKYRANAQVLWQQLLEWLKTVFNVDLSELQALPWRVFSTAAGAFLTTSVSMVTDLMLVVVFLAFILLQPPASQSSLRKKIDDSVSRYIILKSVISFSVAIFVYVLLADLAPYQSVIALTVPFLVHICVGNILEPWLFGQQFSMNPVIILFSLGVWYILWGTVGAVLAVPLTSVLRILCNHLIENNIGMPYISAISSLLEGRSLDLNLSRHKPTEERDAEAAPSSPKDVKS